MAHVSHGRLGHVRQNLLDLVLIAVHGQHLVPQLIQLAGEVITKVSQPENGDTFELFHLMALKTRGSVIYRSLKSFNQS